MASQPMNDIPIYGVVALTLLWFVLGFGFGVLCGRAIEWVEIGQLTRERNQARATVELLERQLIDLL